MNAFLVSLQKILPSQQRNYANYIRQTGVFVFVSLQKIFSASTVLVAATELCQLFPSKQSHLSLVLFQMSLSKQQNGKWLWKSEEYIVFNCFFFQARSKSLTQLDAVCVNNNNNILNIKKVPNKKLGCIWGEFCAINND